MERTLNIAEMVHGSEIYGPGKRTVMWVQGCTLACKGCWNQDLWPKEGGTEYKVSELLARVLANEDDGVTLMGGEPLQQSQSVLRFIDLTSKNGISMMLYSGFEEQEMDSVQQECVDRSDIVILGRYVQGLRNTSLRWRGSSNQIVRYPTGNLDKEYFEEANDVEIHMDETGKIKVLGYPNKELVEFLLDDDHL